MISYKEMTVEELLDKREELEEILSSCEHSEANDINAELDIIEAELEFRRATGED